MLELKKLVNNIINQNHNKKIYKAYFKRYKKYSFLSGHCCSMQQYEASITRWYHTIEKGLSYIDYRPGFGACNVAALVTELQNYVKESFDINSFFYKTALSVLYKYVEKNKEYNHIDKELNETLSKLPGYPNNEGGALIFEPSNSEEIQAMNYSDFIKSRHSIRHFSNSPVDIEKVKRAVNLAQLTPSACNRQGWNVRVIQDKLVLKKVLDNQNGNRGFGYEIDKLILVTSDLRYFNSDREVFQAYIDGGMYAMSLINSLHYECIGTIPLSGSLTWEQDANIRMILGLDDAEVVILLIGAGNYPEKCQTTKSIRHEARMEII